MQIETLNDSIIKFFEWLGDINLGERGHIAAPAHAHSEKTLKQQYAEKQELEHYHNGQHY
ncbi:MAG: hypothetical protein ACI93R_003755 [Flavobacteriales bacterium]|jgi:hypothetical protein